MSAKDTTPLRRWSERKAKARREETPAGAAAPGQETVEEIVEQTVEEIVEPAESEESLPAEVAEQLPDIDSLDKDSDYTVFMGEGVPEHLKRLALRKLWLSDPVLANVDGLVDYGEDFTVAERMGDAVKTAYRVGKGLIEDVQELAEDEEQGEEQDEGEIAQATPDGGGESEDESEEEG